MLWRNWEKNCNLFFVTHCSTGEEERFLLNLFTGDKRFVSLTLVALVDADLGFLLMELEFWMDLLIEPDRYWQMILVNME